MFIYSPCFSALQRAENSSIRDSKGAGRDRDKFQCSSASRKFLNLSRSLTRWSRFGSFSALQRAENSSIMLREVHRVLKCGFQCSSASRKFLNQYRSRGIQGQFEFQCSSASRKFLNSAASTTRNVNSEVSVLFSEPKIPQYRGQAKLLAQASTVSVLFSEPKIPQSMERIDARAVCTRFSALQRAENSSISYGLKGVLYQH